MTVNNDLIAEYELFIKTLGRFPKPWLTAYFNTLKMVLGDLHLSSDSPQLAMSVTKDGNLHVNVGQRWITKPFDDGSIGLILPLEQDLAPLNCERIGFFAKGRMNEALWVSYQFSDALPESLYNVWLAAWHSRSEACENKIRISQVPQLVVL